MACIRKELFGTTKNGAVIYRFILVNKQGMQVEILNYGGAVRAVLVPDKNGRYTDVVLGYDNLRAYEQQSKYVGCIVGRACNRIQNGRFTLNGKTCRLFCNDGKNHLHGGKEGFDKKVFAYFVKDGVLELFYESPDGEEGYPGSLQLRVTYMLSDTDNTLWIAYSAKSDKDTLFAPTNHTYFNLDGHRSPSVVNQRIKLRADRFTQADKNAIPTGKLLPVAGTPLDLRDYTAIGQFIDDPYEQIANYGGYDNNFVINGYDKTCRKAASVYSAETGIALTMYTDLPGVQFYTGNFLDGTPLGKEKTAYLQRSGFCLESQYFPNAVNCPAFETPLLKAGQTARTKTGYQFSVKR